MALTQLNTMLVDHPGSDTRNLTLYQGDVTAIDSANAVDFLCVSALPGDYSPSGSSVIGALAAKGVSLQQLSTNKAANYEPIMPCWISQDVSSAGLNFKRIIVYEPSDPANNAAWDIGMIFRAVQCFQGTNPTSIALPMVCTGSGGADLATVFRQLFFEGSHWAGRNDWPLSAIKLVAYSSGDASLANTQFATNMGQYANPPLVGLNSGSPPAGMTQRQYACVRAYTGSAYYTINAALRANSLTDPSYIAYIATIFGISSGLANLPNYAGLTARGTNLPQSVIDQYSVGATITHYGFTSSSWDRPWPGSCLLKVTSISGKNVSGISFFPAEDEILYDDRMTDLVTAVQGPGNEYGYNYQYRFASNQTVPNYCNC